MNNMCLKKEFVSFFFISKEGAKILKCINIKKFKNFFCTHCRMKFSTGSIVMDFR